MYQPAYSAPRPPSYRATTAINRALAVLAVGAFILVVRHVLAGDPGPGLSGRGWFTIALAALVPVLLLAHRAGRPRRPSRAPLSRAAAEYAMVALLVALLVAPAPVTAPVKASAPAGRPVLVGIMAGVSDAIAELRRQADRSAPPPTTITPEERRP